MSVSVNGPKTPVTKGSSGIATATLPNICKMPGPPAPFVPAPLPNIGKSGDKPKGYSKKVKIESKAVAIKGASFGSIGDMASKGTGGGMLSANTHGPCKFISPGSMDVKFEGGNVHLLTDMVTNNGGPSGSPANAATMMGAIQTTGVVYVVREALCPICNDDPETHTDFGEEDSTAPADAQGLVTAYLNETTVRQSTMIGVVICKKDGKHKYAGKSAAPMREFTKMAKDKGFHAAGDTPDKIEDKMCKRYKDNSEFVKKFEEAHQMYNLKVDAHDTIKVDPSDQKLELIKVSRNPPGSCAAQKALVLALEHDCIPIALSEKFYNPEPKKDKPKKTAWVPHYERRVQAANVIQIPLKKDRLVYRQFGHGDSVPPCETCNLLLPFLTCTKDKPGTHGNPAEGCCKK